MPVILPAEEKVAEMLKGTSHRPDEALGKMNPGSEAGEGWTYTVKTAAIKAVMAGIRVPAESECMAPVRSPVVGSLTVVQGNNIKP